MLYVNPLVAPQTIRADIPGDGSGREKLALQELEHLFAYTLLQELRKSVPKDGLFDGGPQQRFFEDLLDDMLSAEWARTGELGIARMIEEQLRTAEARRDAVQGRETPSRAPETPDTAGLPVKNPYVK